jgi:DNA-binding beta-propeller fold protein YncE
MPRIARLMLVPLLLATVLALRPLAASDGYRIVSRLPDVIDGQALVSLRYDWVSHRLFAGNAVGVYSADMSAAKPKITGPIAHGLVTAIEVAPDLGRVFYAGPTEIGFVDEAGGKGVTIAEHYANSLAYEPTTHELYASFALLNKVSVYDAQTGHLKTDIKLPGWSAFQLVAVPGKVFMLVKGRDGIFAIDPATHTVAPWAVTGKITTPGRLEADPNGRYLFFARMNDVAAIDIASQREIGHVGIYGEPTLSFDPDSGLLVVGWLDNSPEQRDVLHVLRPTNDGLVPVAMLNNETGGTTLVRSHYGFIQHGFHEFLVWSDEKSVTTR